MVSYADYPGPFIIFVFLLFIMYLPINSAYNMGHVNVLVVCSDVNDVMFANSLGAEGGFNVDILYLGKDLPDDRSKLSDVLYLIRYDEIWIPDLNSELTYGGRLKRSEIAALRKYVKTGGILVLGMNTYTQSWSRSFEEITGAKLIRVEKPERYDGWNIFYENQTYRYNATYQTIVVKPYRAEVIAKYLNGLPAVTLSKFGRGIGVLLTFNPVINCNPNLTKLYLAVSYIALNRRDSLPSLSKEEILVIKTKRILLHPVSIGIIVFLTLELMAYLGLLPFKITVVLSVLFLPFSEFLLKKLPYRGILETVRVLRGVTVSDLSRELGINQRRLKFPMALLILKKYINTVDLSHLGVGDPIIVIKGLEAEGVAAWTVSRYPRLMEIIANNPGIGIIDLAHKVNMPPYDVLKFLRELSVYGVVELRKIVVDYEVYPMRALLRWFEI
ncbi:hypothetical protein [Thermococcus sp.]